MTILPDSSIWIDHLRKGEPALERLLKGGEVLSHPLVTGELAVGSIQNRIVILRAIGRLPEVILARHDEVMGFIEVHKLFGRGVGFIDLHLLLSVRLTPEALLWTRDKRLHEIAGEMSIAFDEPAALVQ